MNRAVRRKRAHTCMRFQTNLPLPFPFPFPSPSPSLLSCLLPDLAMTKLVPLDDDPVKHFQVAKKLTFISDPEKQLINRICKLGFYYRRIERFVHLHQFHADIATSTRLGNGSGSTSDHHTRLNATQHTADSSSGDEDDDSKYTGFHSNGDHVTHKFANAASNGGTKPTRSRAKGLYVRALCEGLDEVLSQYRAAVLDIEQDVMKDAVQYPLSRMHFALRDYLLIMAPLNELIGDIAATSATHALHGGHILKLVHRRSQVGIPEVRECMQRLLFHCHKVLFNQISAWVVNGLIVDPYREFFITQVRSSASDVPDSRSRFGWSTSHAARMFGKSHMSTGTGVESLSTQYRSSSNASPSPPDSVSPGFGRSLLPGQSAFASVRAASPNTIPVQSPSPTPLATSGRPAKMMARNMMSGMSRMGQAGVDWNTQFKVLDDMLPEAYIPVSVARKILFIGKAVTILQNHAVPMFGPNLLPHEDVLAFTRTIHHLREQPVFDFLSVNIALDDMRTVVTKHLWNLVVVKAQLVSYLRACKDLFLVSNGQFWQAFIEELMSRNILFERGDKKTRTNFEKDINSGPFHKAAVACGLEDDPHLLCTRIRLEQPSFEFNEFTPENVHAYPKAPPKSVVLVGSSKLLTGQARIRLTGPERAQSAAIWFAARRVVKRGFSCIFNFQISSQRAKQSNAAVSSPSNREALARRPLTIADFDEFYPWGEGFSFVLQNHHLEAVPDVSEQAMHSSLNSHTPSRTMDGKQLHSRTNARRASNQAASGTSRQGSSAYGEELAGMNTSDRAYGTVPNSLEIRFHVVPRELQHMQQRAPHHPAFYNHIAVYIRSAESGVLKLVGRTGPPPSSTVSGPSSSSAHTRNVLLAQGLKSLDDGKAHSVSVQYTPPTGSLPSGSLKVKIDNNKAYVLNVAVDLGRSLNLDDGHAWVGFTAATGYGPASLHQHRNRGRIKRSRVLLNWTFEGVCL
jgi:Gamma tubulin complex component N-terminal